MSYTINLTNGQPLVPGGLSDGTLDTTHSSLTLIGKNYAGYGAFLNENFVKLLENFANSSTSPPPSPLAGQLWWDTTNNILRVWSGNSWKISTGATSSYVEPGDLSQLGGDLWFDQNKQQLKVRSSNSWIVVGPPNTAEAGDTGVFPDVSYGNQIIRFKVGGVTYAIFSKATFTSPETGFISIKPGLNFSTSAVPALGLNTQDTNATASTLVLRDGSGSIAVAGVSATSVTAATFTGNVVATTLSGSLIGNVNATTVSASALTATSITATNIYGTVSTPSQTSITQLGNVTNLSTNGTTSLTGYATYNGSQIATVGGQSTASYIDNTPIGGNVASTGKFTSLQSTSALINTLTANALSMSGSIVPTAGNTYSLGSSTNWFNNIYGKAIQAQYADLAERFHADAEYAPGTVVELGGAQEITKVVQELSEKVFGVISTNAAYLMNSGAGPNATHPPVAMSGRVPVRVVGMIAKGNRLVSAGNGLARAGKIEELTPWNVIGRSLVDKLDVSEGIIEAIVKINS